MIVLTIHKWLDQSHDPEQVYTSTIGFGDEYQDLVQRVITEMARYPIVKTITMHHLPDQPRPHPTQEPTPS